MTGISIARVSETPVEMNAAVECTSANFPFFVAALPYNVAFERLSWVVRHHFALEKRFHSRQQLVAPRFLPRYLHPNS